MEEEPHHQATAETTGKGGGWACNHCGTSDPDLRYRSGKMPECKDCRRLYNIRCNAKRPRRNKRSPSVQFSGEEFLEWSRTRERKCRYCNLPDSEVRNIGMKTQVGLNLETLGIDRIDSEGDYSLDNIDFCCFGCNKIKGDVFSDQEMREIGKTVELVWSARRRSATQHTPDLPDNKNPWVPRPQTPV